MYNVFVGWAIPSPEPGEGVPGTAFLNLDGWIAVAALSTSEQDLDLRVWMDGQAAMTTSLAHSMMTIVI